MTNDEIVTRGQTASLYLADEALMSFFDEMKSDIVTALLSTPADRREDRETLYFQHRGIEDVLATLQLYQARAEEIIRSRTEIVNNTYDD